MEKEKRSPLIALYFCCVLGLKARGNSKLIEGEATVVCLKKKSLKWRWKVRRGYCSNMNYSCAPMQEWMRNSITLISVSVTLLYSCGQYFLSQISEICLDKINIA